MREASIEPHGLSRFLVLAVGSLIVLYTIAPLELDVSNFSARLVEASSTLSLEGWVDAFLHSIAFVAFGFCVGRCVRKLPHAAFVLLLFSFTIEVAQLLVPERHARLPDWIINVVAGFSGIFLSRRYPFSESAHAAKRIVLTIQFVAIVVWLGASLVPARLSLKGWDRNARVVVGNELDGSEPWCGKIFRIAILPRTGAPLWLAYDFTNSSPGEPKGSVSEELALFPKGEMPDAPFVSEQAARSLTKAIVESGTFEVVAELGQTDPPASYAGRLVSLSSSVAARNFMLGRERMDVVFRVRDGLMEENGRNNILVARDALKEPVTSITARYDHGWVTLANHTKLLKAIDLCQPSVALRLGAGAGGAASAGMLFGVFIAFPFSWIVAARWSIAAVLPVVAGTTFLGVLPYAAICWLLRGKINLSFIGITAVAIGLSYLVAHFFCAHNVSALMHRGPSGSQNPL